MADRLHRLRKELIERCNRSLLKSLLDDLQEEKILNNGEVEFIDEGYTLTSDKMRALVDTVMKKGDKASNVLINLVLKRDPVLSADLRITAPSECSLPTQEQNIKPPSQTAPSECSFSTQEQNVQPPTDTNGITLCPKKEYERFCSEEGDQMYPILPREGRTRLALIICNDKFDDCKLKERNGAKFDVEGMEKLLDGLGYKVLKESNLSVKEMKDTMRNFAAEEKHMSSDSTFLVLMSHGHRDVICGTDSQINSDGEVENVLHVDEIFTTFNNVNCHALRDKPKVVVIQACRGNGRGQVWVADSLCDSPSTLPSADQEHLEDDAMRKVHRESDFASFCSSTPDTVSWRDPNRGSLFIQRLIEHMKKDAYRFSIVDIFRNVQGSFKNEPQMPTLERTTLLKKFFLFPGH